MVDRGTQPVLFDLCDKQGPITSDDVLEVIGLPQGLHHSGIGTIFTKGFARMIGVWWIE